MSADINNETKILESLSKMEVSIVGLGLIGGSFAKILRNISSCLITGCSKHQSTIEQAKKLGVINKGTLDATEAVKNADLVIIGLYPKDTLEFLRTQSHSFKPGAIITDVSGVKCQLIHQVRSLLPENVDFISGHPMAGRENSGFTASDGSIFKGSSYILVPQPGNRAEHIQFMENLAKAIGCAKVLKVSPQVHDFMIAHTSHLPYVSAISMMNCFDWGQASDFMGGSFRDATRVAELNADLWTELFLENRENLLISIDEFLGQVFRFRTALAEKKTTQLKHLLIEADQRRRSLYKPQVQ